MQGHMTFTVLIKEMSICFTAWKVSKSGVSSGQYFYWLQKNTDQKKLCVWTLFTECVEQQKDGSVHVMHCIHFFCIQLYSHEKNLSLEIIRTWPYFNWKW